MNKNLIYDGNTIYEVDPECIRKKEENQKEGWENGREKREEIVRKREERYGRI